jgi:transposase InsO family protein
MMDGSFACSTSSTSSPTSAWPFGYPAGLKSIDLIDLLSDLFILRGVPAHIRSDHGPEFVAKAVQEWIGAVGAKTAYITPGSPWENGFIESFNGKRSVKSACR